MPAGNRDSLADEVGDAVVQALPGHEAEAGICVSRVDQELCIQQKLVQEGVCESFHLLCPFGLSQWIF